MADRDCAICRGTGKYPASVDITGKLADCPDCTPEPADALRAALVAIQELHKPVKTQVLMGDCAVEECEHEDDCPTHEFEYCAACNEIAEQANPSYAEDGMGFVAHPCATRKLADEAVGGGERA